MNHFCGKALLSCKCKLHSFVCYICPYVYTHILSQFEKWHFNNLCSSPLLFPQQGQNMLFSHIFSSKSLGRMKSNICLHLCKNKKRPSNQMQLTWFLWKAGGTGEKWEKDEGSMVEIYFQQEIGHGPCD